MGGVQGADGRSRDAWLDGRAAAPRAPWLGRDPQVPRVAALEFGDDRGPGGEPTGEDMYGRVAERAGFVAEVDACLVAQVQGADLEVGEFRNAPAGVGDERGQRGGPQRCQGVGVDG